MRVKTFVGKDPTSIDRKRKPKHIGPIVCRNCGDDLSRGYCIKCSAAMQLYRDVDAARQFEVRIAGHRVGRLTGGSNL